MKSKFENIVNRIKENIWPFSPKKLTPVKVHAPSKPHPAEVKGGSRNYPPTR